MNYNSYAYVETIHILPGNSIFYLRFESGSRFIFKTLPELFTFCDINRVRIDKWVE